MPQTQLRIKGLNQYQDAASEVAFFAGKLQALRTRINKIGGSTAEDIVEFIDGLHYTTEGLGSEVGEVCSKVKKLFRDGDPLAVLTPGYETDEKGEMIHRMILAPGEFRDGMLCELGGVFWYLSQAARVCGISLEEVAQYNADQLRSRQARGTLSGSGDNR